MVIGAWKGRFVLAIRSTLETKRVRYLLGLTSQTEREQIESEYFENEDAFQEMLTVEDDLIDAYVRGELAGEERRSFEKSFASSLHGRDRVQFARALAGTVSDTRSVKTKLPHPLLDIFKIFQSPGVLRTATTATMIVLVVALAWLLTDRRRMSNELRELRAQSAELSKQTGALQQSSDTEQTHTAAQRADLPAHPDKPKHSARRTTAIQRARHKPEVKNIREEFVTVEAQASKIFPNREDNSPGTTPEKRRTIEIPFDSGTATLLTLRTATTRDGQLAGGRADQSNVALEGVETLKNGSLIPRNTISSSEPTIRIPSSLSWTRFEIVLETAAIHEDYRVTIKTADGRPVTSVDWSEPLTPNQTTIDTPAISTDNLTSGDYVLLLMGKEPDGSFVKVRDYSFKLIKY